MLQLSNGVIFPGFIIYLILYIIRKNIKPIWIMKGPD